MTTTRLLHIKVSATSTVQNIITLITYAQKIKTQNEFFSSSSLQLALFRPTASVANADAVANTAQHLSDRLRAVASLGAQRLQMTLMLLSRPLYSLRRRLASSSQQRVRQCHCLVQFGSSFPLFSCTYTSSRSDTGASLRYNSQRTPWFYCRYNATDQLGPIYTKLFRQRNVFCADIKGTAFCQVADHVYDTAHCSGN